MTDRDVIEKLRNYNRLVARKEVLETYSVGGGITVSRLNQDDHLQELHGKLRGLPSHMYLSLREQRLEKIAGERFEWFPAGVKSQLRAVPEHGTNAEDTKLLKELKDKIAKVVAARGYDVRDDLDLVLERVAELQYLQEEISRIDTLLHALGTYRPEQANILRLIYVEGKEAIDIRNEFEISARTFSRRRSEAEREYMILAQ
ncbi:MAG TPA: RNA polymerase subunit sigma-24 [Candidatus Paenibacillus intestinavium]|nr:RNA polymerase subunit sigma-24 [Candidatus Paenibacillus intestinavium]